MLKKIKSWTKKQIRKINILWQFWMFLRKFKAIFKDINKKKKLMEKWNINTSEGHLGGYTVGGDPDAWFPKLWDWIVKELKVQSVLDIGCGEGYSTKYFKELGCDVLGIDGSPTAIRDNIVPKNVVQHDFCKRPYIPNKKYDVVWSCEFVEHVEEKYVQNFLETFKFAKKYIFMTYAEPGQVGWHHVNCKTKKYWIKKISQMGFRFNHQLTRFAKTLCEGHFSKHGLVFTKK